MMTRQKNKTKQNFQAIKKLTKDNQQAKKSLKNTQKKTTKTSKKTRKKQKTKQKTKQKSKILENTQACTHFNHSPDSTASDVLLAYAPRVHDARADVYRATSNILLAYAPRRNGYTSPRDS